MANLTLIVVVSRNSLPPVDDCDCVELISVYCVYERSKNQCVCVCCY